MRQAFTLLELLIVISIIGILAVLAFPNYMAARERARDVQRKSDLKQMQKALEIYKLDQNPPNYVVSGAGNTFPNSCASWVSGSTIYMNKVPANSCSPSTVSYYYNSVSGSLTYTLAACLENAADPDGQVCPGGYTCTSTKCYIINQP